jgi:hypothetical protein
MVNKRPNSDEGERIRIHAHYNRYFQEYDTDEKFYEKLTDDLLKMGYEAGLRRGRQESSDLDANRSEPNGKFGVDFGNPDHQQLLHRIADLHERLGYDDALANTMIDCLKTFGKSFTDSDASAVRSFLTLLRDIES